MISSRHPWDADENGCFADPMIAPARNSRQCLRTAQTGIHERKLIKKIGRDARLPIEGEDGYCDIAVA